MVVKGSAGRNRMIRMEEGFQLLDVTAYEGDIGSFPVA
jgi:hypothetical protein